MEWRPTIYDPSFWRPTCRIYLYNLRIGVICATNILSGELRIDILKKVYYFKDWGKSIRQVVSLLCVYAIIAIQNHFIIYIWEILPFDSWASTVEQISWDETLRISFPLFFFSCSSNLYKPNVTIYLIEVHSIWNLIKIPL